MFQLAFKPLAGDSSAIYSYLDYRVHIKVKFTIYIKFLITVPSAVYPLCIIILHWIYYYINNAQLGSHSIDYWNHSILVLHKEFH